MKTYYKINEISKLYNIGQDALRYYETLGILQPMRDKNNYRQYTTRDIYRLNVIRDLRNLGFSMRTIKDYIQNRTIYNSLELMKREECLIDKKIQELYAMKNAIIERQTSLETSLHLPMETMEILTLAKRKCVSLKTDQVHDTMEYQLMKLSKEYEENIYTIGNFNTGYFLDIQTTHAIHPTSVFIMGSSLIDFEFTLPSGQYLTMYYAGSRDIHYIHLKKMLHYCDVHSLTIGDHIMEFFIIDTHETKHTQEYITQLQIELLHA